MNILRFGIVQYPKKLSMSEKVFNKYFQEINIDAVYEGININPSDFDFKIKDVLNNYYGLNITVPYKERIFKYLNAATDSAIFLSAINTIHKGIGYNTDWIGFYNSIINEDLNGDILVLGAGGAAKAILYGLYKIGIDRVKLINRTYERAIELKKLFNKKIKIEIEKYEKINTIINDVDIFINTTSLGMFNERLPVKLNEKLSLVYDVVYFHTPLQKKAESLGIKTINGKMMWYYQAVENLKIWNLFNEEKFLKIKL
ncbi:shikimate dehydrogenase family protein [Marinitoga aeolica]|uniref:shikimate dehydrogenase (NADP(+)) n=1 Tax=Marinitoga aeolica TaxID=2809031 RepID=A0ABY8PP46_9BACT|nr:shikimate dehydrogenase [Marinitoga aeolica]WGS64411.1 shikimate dehydrogenase [Marinitoga aeolica]